MLEIVGHSVLACPSLFACIFSVPFSHTESQQWRARSGMPNWTPARLVRRSARSGANRIGPGWMPEPSSAAVALRPAMAHGSPDSAARTGNNTIKRSDRPTTRPRPSDNVFTFVQARERTRAFFDRKRRELAGQIEERTGPLTVEELIRVYLANRRKEGSKGVRADEVRANALVLPAPGAVEAERSPSARSMLGAMPWPIRPAACGRASSPTGWHLTTGGHSGCELELLGCTPVACEGSPARSAGLSAPR
jgi:hypothetical protein